MIRCKIPWTNQPQAPVSVNWNNSLGKTITHCLPLNGLNSEIVTGKNLVISTTNAWKVDVRGKSLLNNGAAACASIPLDLSQYTKLTLSFWLYWDAYASDDKLAMEYGANYFTNSGFIIDPNEGSAFGIYAGGGGYNGGAIARPSVAAWHHYFVTIDRTQAAGVQGLKVYVDGVLKSFSSPITDNVSDNFGNNTLFLFSRNNASLFGAGRLQNIVLRGGYLGSAVEAKSEFDAPWSLFKPQTRNIWVPSAGGSAALAGNAAAQAAATGALTTGIPLTGASASASTATGTLTTDIPLEGSAASVSLANGVLTTQINLSADVLAMAAATGSLTTQITLSGAALAQALATADLTTAPQGLAGNATASATGSATLTTGIPLAGAASAFCVASGGLITGIPLAGVAASVASATGDLTISITMSADAMAQAAASGLLTTQIPLAGAASAQAAATGTFAIQIPLEGAALAQALASGSLTAQILLVGEASGQATATGSFGTDVAPVTGGDGDDDYHYLKQREKQIVAARKKHEQHEQDTPDVAPQIVSQEIKQPKTPAKPSAIALEATPSIDAIAVDLKKVKALISEAAKYAQTKAKARRNVEPHEDQAEAQADTAISMVMRRNDDDEVLVMLIMAIEADEAIRV